MNTVLPKLLVVSPNWLGDAIMTEPLLKQLSQHYCIDVFAPTYLSQIFQAMPYIDKIHSHTIAHKQFNLKQLWHYAKQFKGNYDACLILPNSLKSAIIPWLSRIPKRIGYSQEARFLLLTHYLNKDSINKKKLFKKQNTAQSANIVLPANHYLIVDSKNQQQKLMYLYYYRLLNVFNHFFPTLNKQTKNEQNTNLPVLEVNEIQAQQTCKAFNLYYLDKNIVLKDYMIIGMGAEFGEAKRWPSLYFAALIEELLNNNNQLTIVLLGLEKDKQLLNEWQINYAHLLDHPACINLMGKTTLLQAMHLIKFSKHVLVHDSGLMHMACALGAQVTAIYGSSSPYHTPPLSKHADVFYTHDACSPCFAKKCPKQNDVYSCLKQISVKQMYQHLSNYLK